MKFNQWTLGLAAVGVVSLASAARADEKASSVMTALSSTTISGYVDTSMQWNLGSGNAGAPAYGFGGASKADGFNLNVVKLTIEKPVDAADAWGAGYKVDLLFGPDASAFATSSTGVSTADFAVKQAYVTLHAPVGNGLDFKVGVWDTIVGYEVFESVNNPNFTRSWGYSIEPTTHTGVLATYQVCSDLSASAGIANTFGPGINARTVNFNGTQNESYKTYLASLAFTAPTNWAWASGSVLYLGIINGFNAASPTSAVGRPADQTHLYAGATINTPWQKLKTGIAYDYVAAPQQNRTSPTTFGTPSGYANAVALYTTFQATEKLGLNGRAEYSSRSFGPAVGVPSKVIALTATAQYDLWKNVVSRLELRWDHCADGVSAFGNPGVAGLKNSFEVIANIAYKF